MHTVPAFADVVAQGDLKKGFPLECERTVCGLAEFVGMDLRKFLEKNCALSLRGKRWSFGCTADPETGLSAARFTSMLLVPRIMVTIFLAKIVVPLLVKHL